MLEHLPPELLQAILSFVHHKQQLLALSTVSRTLRDAVFARVFEVVTIDTTDERFFYAGNFADVQNVIAAIRDLRIVASSRDAIVPSSIALRWDDRVHSSKAGPSIRSRATLLLTYGQRVYQKWKLGRKLADFLSFVCDNRLSSFSWDVGIACLDEILGTSGYLATHQKRIETLVVRNYSHESTTALSLTEFANLQNVSWKGFVSKDECQGLRAYFKLCHEKLRCLTLDFTRWTQPAKFAFVPPEGFLALHPPPWAESMLPERDDDFAGFLPNVETVSLSTMSLEHPQSCFLDALKLHRVKRLRFSHCEPTFNMILSLSDTEPLCQATNLELVLDNLEPDLETIINFEWLLRCFDSLEDFFILYRPSDEDTFFTRAIAEYRNTLKRLVYHKRRHRPYEAPPCDESWTEASQASSGLSRILGHTVLEVLGTCARPSFLQQDLKTIAQGARSLVLLHLRFTGDEERKTKSPYDSDLAEYEEEDDELEDFAGWAFGPEGFPRLQILVTGDFSQGDRFANRRTVWCRNDHNLSEGRTWRTVGRNDLAAEELIDANMDLLRACPVTLYC